MLNLIKDIVAIPLHPKEWSSLATLYIGYWNVAIDTLAP